MAKGGRVIWLTGLSGSGKTTLGSALQQELPGSILLDGDELRQVLGITGKGYDRESRKNLAFTYARFAKLLANQGFTVIVATISLFHELHAWNRKNLPGYLEVFLDIPERVRRSRDPKGLYAANVSNMADNDAEFPRTPDLRLDQNQTLENSLVLLKKSLNS